MDRMTLPAQLPEPVEVRRQAQRGRRAAGGVAAVVAVVAAVMVMTGGGPGPDKSETVVSPTPLPTLAASGPLALLVTAMMTAPDWEPLVGQPAERVGDYQDVGIGCAIDIPLAARDSTELTGRYRQPDGSELSEFLHPLDDVAQAEKTFAGIRDRLTSCHSNTAEGGGPGFDVTATTAAPALMQPAGPLDEVFVGRSTSGPAYQVAVARDDNIVVVLESTGVDFPAVQALETVLAHGIRGAAGRCTAVLTGSGTRCWSDAPGVAHRPYWLAPDPALDLNSWSVAGITPAQTRYTPADTPGCLGQPRDWGAKGVWASTVQTQYPYTNTWVNEYVLDGGTASRAATMFDALVEQWRTCRAGRSHPFPLETDPEVLGSGFEDLFHDTVRGRYTLAIARDENVVVLIEVTGYVDASVHILRTAMDQAVTEQFSRRRVDSSFRVR